MPLLRPYSAHPRQAKMNRQAEHLLLTGKAERQRAKEQATWVPSAMTGKANSGLPFLLAWHSLKGEGDVSFTVQGAARRML